MLRRIDEALRAGPAPLAALVREFAAIVDNRDFPCSFSTLPFATGEICFDLVPAAGEDVAAAVVSRLRELCTRIRTTPDMLGVVFVEQPGSPSLADDFALAGRIVRAVLDANERDHPGARFLRPHEPHWELWLDGVGLFLNFSSPRHVARRSRNVGPRFTVIAQERKSFDRQGRGSTRARERIRRRIGRYDDVPPHPSLGRFGDPGSLEVLQFFLGDGTEPLDPSKRCHRG